MKKYEFTVREACWCSMDELCDIMQEDGWEPIMCSGYHVMGHILFKRPLIKSK